MALGFGSRAGGATVKLVVDDQQFNRDLRSAQQNFRRTTGSMGGDVERLSRGALAGSGAFSHLGRSIAFASSTFLGAAGFTALVKDSISAASDLHEQINKVDVVFRGSQKTVLDWSETTAKGLGIARGQALGFAATFGNLLVPMGIGRQKAAEMSVQFVQLAADLASFNNASPEDTLRALQSGLAGQVRPLRQFGIFLDQNRIKAEALRLGLLKGNVDLEKVRIANERVAIAQAQYNKALKDFGPNTTQAASAHVRLEQANNNLAKATSGATGQLTQQQKVLATTSIIMRDSRDAQGDFSRTSGGLANQQRILKAEITDLEEKLGTALLPTVLKLVRHMTDWLGKTKNQKELQHDLNEVIKTAGEVLQALLPFVTGTKDAFKFLADRVGGTKHAFELLFALGIVGKLRAISVALGVAGASGRTGGIAGSAENASTKVGGLRTKLLGLSKLPPISIPIALLIGSVVVQPYVTKFLNNLLSKIGINPDASHVQGAGPVVDMHTGKLVWPSGAPYKPGQKRDPGAPPGGGGTSGGTGRPDDRSGVRGAGGTGTPGGGSVVSIALTAARSPGASSRSFHLPGEAQPYDCSAFVQAVFAHAGIHIGRDTYAQAAGGRSIARNDLQPGDIILFNITQDVQRAPNHVGIYVGGGYMVHDHGDHSGGVSYQAVPWGAFWGARCYIGGHVHHGEFTGKGGGGTGGSTGAGGSRGGGGGGDTGSDGGLTVGSKQKKTKPKIAPDVPLVLQEKLAKAQLTKPLDDDLKALDAIQDYLEKRIARTKKIKDRVRLLKELGSVRRQIASISEKLPKTQQGYVQVGASPGLGIAPVSAPVAKPGQTEVNIPGIGKILVGTEQAPTLDQIRTTIVDVYNKIVAAQKRRDAKKKALAKLLKIKIPNAKQRAAIKKLQRDINKLNQTIADLKDDLGQYIGAANDLVAEMADDAEQKAGESEGDAGSGPEDNVGNDIAQGSITDIPVNLSYGLAVAQFGGDVEGQRTALEAEATLLESRLSTTKDLSQRIDLMNAITGIRDQLASTATAVSPALQLAQAQARLTPGTADDIQIVRQLKSIAEARLKEATTIQEQIALTNQLADLKSQLNEEQGQENAQLIAYVNARRDLARTFASNVLSRSIGNPQITVQNFNQPTPQDPHIWSQQVMFELRSLVS